MHSGYSVFEILLQIFLLFKFPSLIRNLVTVKVLMISCCQTKVSVLLQIILHENDHLK